jgi:pimeloyl-ACP methyl ester carboxylesterase
MKYQYLSVNNCKIFYREAGNPENPTILLLHGFPSASHMFRDLMPELADKPKTAVLPGWSFRLKYLYLHDSNPPVYENSHRTSPRLSYRMQHNGASGWVFE